MVSWLASQSKNKTKTFEDRLRESSHRHLRKVAGSGYRKPQPKLPSVPEQTRAKKIVLPRKATLDGTLLPGARPPAPKPFLVFEEGVVEETAAQETADEGEEGASEETPFQRAWRETFETSQRRERLRQQFKNKTKAFEDRLRESSHRHLRKVAGSGYRKPQPKLPSVPEQTRAKKIVPPRKATLDGTLLPGARPPAPKPFLGKRTTSGSPGRSNFELSVPSTLSLTTSLSTLQLVEEREEETVSEEEHQPAATEGCRTPPARLLPRRSTSSGALVLEDPDERLLAEMLEVTRRVGQFMQEFAAKGKTFRERLQRVRHSHLDQATGSRLRVASRDKKPCLPPVPEKTPAKEETLSKQKMLDGKTPLPWRPPFLVGLPRRPPDGTFGPPPTVTRPKPPKRPKKRSRGAFSRISMIGVYILYLACLLWREHRHRQGKGHPNIVSIVGWEFRSGST
ncbi:unnamed protein product [Vitrella brassicaformis CCMP3155]|uniref:Uncharacterized protein n=1 Tax=Vitrella brassicaformis (strain CCMP3155) TaxID=1169540 RepID=A0A0G4F2A2_VITBC|nr:unnamed protein product [Vitrella brassicaformis CCMP3155]|eukprot:CEM05492.1 unnamed protein product [Vitrella brassicaformis CCMP3155]